jgi:hypothetical protein
LKDTWLDLSEDNPYSHLMTVMGGVNQLECMMPHPYLTFVHWAFAQVGLI